MNILLFSRTYDLIGEFRFSEEGVFESATLSSNGQERFGDLVESWRVQGIPIRHVREEVQDDGVTRRIIEQERVQIRSVDAATALGCWAVDRELIVYEVTDRMMGYWHRLSMLEMESEERFVSLQAMCRAPFRLLHAWDQALNQMLAVSPS